MFLHDKKGLGKKKGDTMTRFWYTLKNLDPPLFYLHQLLISSPPISRMKTDYEGGKNCHIVLFSKGVQVELQTW